jgi:hypothetical protein
MFDIQEFFPTPAHIVSKMLSKISKDAVYFLEPSAGRGDIASRIAGDPNDRWSGNKRKVDCIEQNPELCSILTGKGLSVVGYDWLTYGGVSYYDAVIMNPPYSNGDDHLLRAWDFLHDGEIVCLLNAETLRNPHSAARKRLAGIIEAHGSTEDLGACFSTAVRKTDVEVVMVYLKKISDDDTMDMWASVTAEREANDDIGADPDMLAIRDDLGNMEHYYNSANEHMLKAFAHLRKAQLYFAANNIPVSGEETYEKIAAMAYKNTNTARAAFSVKHKRDAWTQVFNRMQFRKWLDKKQTDEFLRDIEKSSDVPFTKENIRGTLANVFEQRNRLFHKSVANVFDALTSTFNGNTTFVGGGSAGRNGWKTNDSYKVNEKVIFPWGCRYDDSSKKYGGVGNFDLYSNHAAVDIYNDLDRVLAVLNGDKFEEINTIGAALRNRFYERGYDHHAPNNWVDSQYFTVKYWMKGTVHLIWKDKALWEKFNLAASKGKNWIGTSTQGPDGGPREQKPQTPDPEAELRQMYTKMGIPKARQDAMIAELRNKPPVPSMAVAVVQQSMF